MTETIAVLFIFFVLVLFGIIFYARYQQIALKERSEELIASRAMDTSLKSLFLPELICSKGEAEPEDNCFDLMKLRHSQEVFQNHRTEYYFNLFSYAKITVREIYPDSGREWVLYDKEKTTTLENSTIVPDWTTLEPTYFIISLRDESGSGDPVYTFGYLKVEVYS